MGIDDNLLHLLMEFFELPPDYPPEKLAQGSIPAWDSLAMVQLIAELERVFNTEFELHEVERLRSYAEIREALARRRILQ
jgi:acyl carrier protein